MSVGLCRVVEDIANMKSLKTCQLMRNYIPTGLLQQFQPAWAPATYSTKLASAAKLTKVEKRMCCIHARYYVNSSLGCMTRDFFLQYFFKGHDATMYPIHWHFVELDSRQFSVEMFVFAIHCKAIARLWATTWHLLYVLFNSINGQLITIQSIN